MTYTLQDAIQSGIGAFIAIITFFAIRGNNPFFFEPKMGLVITIILLSIYYNGFKMKHKQSHFIVDIAIAFMVCAVMAKTFGLITIQEIFSLKVFGSLVIIGLWIAFPAGWLYDRFNIHNPMKASYVRGK